jgi:Ca2+-dependent lipid-binding protein
MPGILRVRVRAGRDLPVMERSRQSTDAYVEIRFKDETFKSTVCRNSLNPQWDNAVFEFEVFVCTLPGLPSAHERAHAWCYVGE